MSLKGDKYGVHRVISPEGVLPQAAQQVDNDISKQYSNEIICDVSALNIDSASFAQIKEACQSDKEKMKEMILSIVQERGKMQNPVTGSGGVFLGTVSYIGEELKDHEIQVGDSITSLISLSLTPLYIEEIEEIHMDIDRVDITGKAVLFESGLYAKMPTDLSAPLALAALDVAGAPAQTAKLVQSGDSVLIIGAAGKSGVLCTYEAMKRVGPTGNVVCQVQFESQVEEMKKLELGHHVMVANAQRPVESMQKALEGNAGKEFDVAILCVNAPNCEMSAILPVRDNGIVYFFSMSTSFTRAALGAEGVGKDITMIVGNGYTKGHAEIALEELRENAKIRKEFEEKYI